jgi:hypothetical protein
MKKIFKGMLTVADPGISKGRSPTRKLPPQEIAKHFNQFGSQILIITNNNSFVNFE